MTTLRRRTTNDAKAPSRLSAQCSRASEEENVAGMMRARVALAGKEPPVAQWRPLFFFFGKGRIARLRFQVRLLKGPFSFRILQPGLLQAGPPVLVECFMRSMIIESTSILCRMALGLAEPRCVQQFSSLRLVAISCSQVSGGWRCTL